MALAQCMAFPKQHIPPKWQWLTPLDWDSQGPAGTETAGMAATAGTVVTAGMAAIGVGRFTALVGDAGIAAGGGVSVLAGVPTGPSIPTLTGIALIGTAGIGITRHGATTDLLRTTSILIPTKIAI